MRRTIDDTVRSWERALLVTRVAICGLITLRALWIWHFDRPEVIAANSGKTLPAVAVTGVFLVAALSISMTRLRLMVHLSVALDAMASFAALATNALWPWPGYTGLLSMPDLGALLVVIATAGLRLSATAAILGGVLNSAAFVALMIIDRKVSGSTLQSRPDNYALYGILLTGASALALAGAVRARRLVERGVRAALTADAAERELETVMHEHHDLRSALSAAQLNAQRLVGDLSTEERTALGGHLKADLDEVASRISGIKAQTMLARAAKLPRQPVETGDVARAMVAVLAPRFPGVTMSLVGDAGRAEVAGGAAGLQRILLNLLVNACEGDGLRGATRVDITLRADSGRALVDIDDDGPGFPPETLSASAPVTTKPAGSGLGLHLVRVVLGAGNGTFVICNRAEGGARVSLSMPQL